MTRNIRAAALPTIILLLAFHATSQAESAPSLVGAWSTSIPGQGGTAHVAESFDADGTYVSVRQEPNGSMLRMWGRYRAVSLSSSQVRLEHDLQGWLPRRICAQSPGFAMKCNPFTPPAAPPVTLTFSSPSAFTVNGIQVTRDTSTTLLHATVDEQLVMAAPAPVKPLIAQPVMPTLHPYVTPHDPTAGPAREDIQQQRICAVNNGQVVREFGGRLRCVN